MGAESRTSILARQEHLALRACVQEVFTQDTRSDLGSGLATAANVPPLERPLKSLDLAAGTGFGGALRKGVGGWPDSR